LVFSSSLISRATLAKSSPFSTLFAAVSTFERSFAITCRTDTRTGLE
jgi:hypothetical protein